MARKILGCICLFIGTAGILILVVDAANKQVRIMDEFAGFLSARLTVFGWDKFDIAIALYGTLIIFFVIGICLLSHTTPLSKTKYTRSYKR